MKALFFTSFTTLSLLLLLTACDSGTNDPSNPPTGGNSISRAGITITSTGNTIIDEINFARVALGKGGADAQRYYDEVIVPNAMTNADMPQRLAEVKAIFYGTSDMGGTTQAQLRTLTALTQNSAISSDIDNYTVATHDTSQWRQGERAEVAWFSDMSPYTQTANTRALGAVVNWITDSGNSPNFGHRTALLNPSFSEGGATSDVTNSMNGQANSKSGGHVVARFK